MNGNFKVFVITCILTGLFASVCFYFFFKIRKVFKEMGSLIALRKENVKLLETLKFFKEYFNSMNGGLKLFIITILLVDDFPEELSFEIALLDKEYEDIKEALNSEDIYALNLSPNTKKMRMCFNKGSLFVAEIDKEDTFLLSDKGKISELFQRLSAVLGI